jgi:hypothetical protein
MKAWAKLVMARIPLHACNPSIQKMEISNSMAGGLSRQKASGTASPQISMVVHSWNLSYTGSIGRRITVPGQASQKMGPYVKINKSTKGWRCDSNSRVLT